MKAVLLAYVATVTMGFCQNAERVIPEEFRTRLGKVVDKTEWPGNVSRIVAVTYDYLQEAKEEVVVDGRLHKGVFLTSKDLTPEQTKKLYSAITGSHVHMKGALCFDPHHGFIFYDADDKILGSLTICFGCNRYRHAPVGDISQVFDLKGLESLVEELGMPIAKEESVYPRLFEEYKKANKPAMATPDPP